MRYSDKEMARYYKPGEEMTFAKGAFRMTAEAASKLTFGLVDIERETGCYRRINCDPSFETMLINEATLRDQMKAGSYDPSPWSSSRLR